MAPIPISRLLPLLCYSEGTILLVSLPEILAVGTVFVVIPIVIVLVGTVVDPVAIIIFAMTFFLTCAVLRPGRSTHC